MPLRRRRRVAGIDQDDLLDPEALADPDSSFYEISGVRVHHKVCAHYDSGDQSSELTLARTRIGLPIVLLHGFGASVFSWSRVMRPLARIAGAKVLAFDRPAFGLTSRAGWPGDDTKALNHYSMAFSSMATLAFIDQLGVGKAILVGHSAGCLVAVEAYFKAPDRVAALVLVAPAIFASARKDGRDKGASEQQGPEKKDSDGSSNAPPNPFAGIWRGFLGMCMWLAGLVLKVVMAVQDMLRALSCKVLVALLRSSLAASLVRLIMDKFGVMVVRHAWYDPSKVTDHVIQGYTKPLRSRGWEKALLEYTISMISTIEHLLIGCVVAREVWHAVLEEWHMTDRMLGVDERLEAWWTVQPAVRSQKRDTWSILILVMWSIWTHRNNVVFNGEAVSAALVIRRIREEVE